MGNILYPKLMFLLAKSFLESTEHIEDENRSARPLTPKTVKSIERVNTIGRSTLRMLSELLNVPFITF